MAVLVTGEEISIIWRLCEETCRRGNFSGLWLRGLHVTPAPHPGFRAVLSLRPQHSLSAFDSALSLK